MSWIRPSEELPEYTKGREYFANIRTYVYDEVRPAIMRPLGDDDKKYWWVVGGDFFFSIEADRIINWWKEDTEKEQHVNWECVQILIDEQLLLGAPEYIVEQLKHQYHITRK